jgi:hypothetical protein
LKISISNAGTFDIDPLRYRRIIDIEAFYIDIDSSRYRRYVDIKVQNFDIVIYRYRRFSRYRQMPLRYLYTISKILCFDIEFRVLRYRCFFRIQPGLPTRYWTLAQIALQTNHYPWLMCRPGRPQPPQRRLHSAARPHPLHRAQHRPQPPDRGSAAGAAAAAAGAGINGTQERVIIGDKNGLAPSLRPQEQLPQPPERASTVTERRSV